MPKYFYFLKIVAQIAANGVFWSLYFVSGSLCFWESIFRGPRPPPRMSHAFGALLHDHSHDASFATDHKLARMLVVRDLIKVTYVRPFFLCSEKSRPCSFWMWIDVQPIAKVSSWIPVCDPNGEKEMFQQRSPVLLLSERQRKLVSIVWVGTWRAESSILWYCRL